MKFALLGVFLVLFSFSPLIQAESPDSKPVNSISETEKERQKFVRLFSKIKALREHLEKGTADTLPTSELSRRMQITSVQQTRFKETKPALLTLLQFELIQNPIQKPFISVLFEALLPLVDKTDVAHLEQLHESFIERFTKGNETLRPESHFFEEFYGKLRAEAIERDPVSFVPLSEAKEFPEIKGKKSIQSNALKVVTDYKREVREILSLQVDSNTPHKDLLARGLAFLIYSPLFPSEVNHFEEMMLKLQRKHPDLAASLQSSFSAVLAAVVKDAKPEDDVEPNEDTVLEFRRLVRLSELLKIRSDREAKRYAFSYKEESFLKFLDKAIEQKIETLQRSIQDGREIEHMFFRKPDASKNPFTGEDVTLGDQKLGTKQEEKDLEELLGFKQMFESGTNTSITDKVLENLALDIGRRHAYFNPDIEIRNAILRGTAVQKNRKIQLIQGRSGQGVSSYWEIMASFYADPHTDNEELFRELHETPVVLLQTDYLSLKRLGPNDEALAIARYLNTLEYFEKLLCVRFFLVIEDFSRLSDAMQVKLKDRLARRSSLWIGATGEQISDPYGICDIHRLPEWTAKKSEEALVGSLKPVLHRLRVSIPNEMYAVLVQHARQAYPQLASPKAEVRYAEELLVYTLAKHKIALEQKSELYILTLDDVKKFDRSLRPESIDPENPKEFLEHFAKLKSIILENTEQAHVVELLVKQRRDLFKQDAPPVKSLFLIGPEDSAKDAVVAEYVRAVYEKQDAQEVLVLSGSDYQHESTLFKLTGMPGESELGVLTRWLATLGSRGGVIVLKEPQQMHATVQKVLGTLMKTGKVTAPNGRAYSGARIHVLGSSKRGGDNLFVREFGKNTTAARLESDLRTLTEEKIKEYFSELIGFSHLDTEKPSADLIGAVDEWSSPRPILLPDAVSFASRYLEKFKAGEKTKGNEIHIDPDVIDLIAKQGFVFGEGVGHIQKQLKNLLSKLEELSWYELGRTTKLNVQVSVKNVEVSPRAVITDATSGVVMAEIPLHGQEGYRAFHDPERLKRLMDMEEFANARIFGQEKFLGPLIRSRRAHALAETQNKPFSAMITGSTGTGKTKSIYVLSEAEFGTTKNVYKLNFGDIRDENAFNNFFGTAAGVVDSDKISPFEEAIANVSKNGGDIAADELFNVGGGDPKLVSIAVKNFYEVLDGKWTSPRGKTYIIGSNVRITFTSNVGDSDVDSQNDDTLREMAWKHMNNRAYLEQKFMAAGATRPFLDRISYVGAAKPLAQKERVEIVKSFGVPVFQTLEKLYPQMKIIPSSRFYENGGRGFFSIKSGGRAAQRFIEEITKPFIVSDVILPLRETFAQPGVKLEVELDLDLRIPPRPWAVPEPVKEQPRAVLIAKVYEVDSNGVRSLVRTCYREEARVSGPALVWIEDAKQTNIHEGGHVVEGKHTGKPDGDLQFVTIEPALTEDGVGTLGYALSDHKRISNTITLRSLVARLAMLAGGSVSQREFFKKYHRDAGWFGDTSSMNKVLAHIILKYGLIDEFKAIMRPRKKDGPRSLDEFSGQDEFEMYEALPDHGKISKERLLEIAYDLFTIGEEYSKFINKDPEVRQQKIRLFNALMKKPTMSGKEVDEVIGDYLMPLEKRERWLDKMLAEYENPKRSKNCEARAKIAAKAASKVKAPKGKVRPEGSFEITHELAE